MGNLAHNAISSGVEQDSNLADEISARVDELRNNAALQGQNLIPPVLVLGVSERVGSNWFLDTLANSVHTHNEPFRQQLHGSHPLSTAISRPIGVADYSLSEMHPYERYWLTNFVTSKYGVIPQAVKETNLFFATQNFVDLFPHSKAVILSRSPVGIAGSFADNNLFKKWNYAERYNQLKAMTRQPQYERYGFIFEGQHDPGSLRKLTRLIVMNTLLVCESLGEREQLSVTYEASVGDRDRVLARASQFLLGEGASLVDLEEDSSVMPAEHVFSTRRNRNGLTTHLEPEDTQIIRSEVRRLLADSLTILTDSEYEKAQELLEHTTDDYVAVGTSKLSRVEAPTEKNTSNTSPAYENISDPESNILWGNQLVANRDFVEFINAMYQEGVPNVINGAQLFVNENMIPDRGGRVWFNTNKGVYEITPSYEDHPVYWVTWLGAAAYARYKGGRLPDRSEMQRLVDSQSVDLSGANCDHKNDDVLPAGLTPPNAIGMYDMVGNLSVWCRDGYLETPGQSLNRYIFGTAWNRSGTPHELSKIKSRPVSGCSRSVGIRLIEDSAGTLAAPELAQRFEGWFKLLNQATSHSHSDLYIIDQLTR